jgi:hypothetical protein
MVSFTPAWTKQPPEGGFAWRLAAWLQRVGCLMGVCMVLGLMPRLVCAQTAQIATPQPGSLAENAPPIPVTTGPLLKDLRVERTTEGVVLSIQLDLALPAGVEDVLSKAVPVYFVMQADVLRERWYWSDQRISRQARTYRLAYQPLTRQWRLSMAAGAGPGATLDYALHQNHASLSSALFAMSRQNHWVVADAEQLPSAGDFWVDFRFSLDATLLPRPFQFGVGTGGWALDVKRRLPVPAVVAPVVSSADPGRDP